MKKNVLFVIILCLIQMLAKANNVSVSNVSVSNGNLSFQLSWENSWNSTNAGSPVYPKNWDAVWVFLKYQQSSDKLWKHLKVSSNSGDHSVTGGGAVLQADAVSDSMGVFVRRSGPGAGNISNAVVSLKLTAGLPMDTLNFKVFAIEMVHIPQDTFHLGDGASNASGRFTPLTITAAEETGGLAAGALYSGSPAIPGAFPLGYSSFYCMKYELTSQQWVDFLNTLPYAQQAARTGGNPNGAANTVVYSGGYTASIIRIMTPGVNNTQPAVYGVNFDGDGNLNEGNDGGTIALGGINKADLLAYLDWSALRPMSEMEFEKVCRGPLPRVLNEYPWGSTDNYPVSRTNLQYAGSDSERHNSSVPMTNGRANFYQGTTGSGMLRSGIFANGSSGREVAGAGFYGNMELAGNAWETVVWADAAGAVYTGMSGDGTLGAFGDADVAGWPSGTAGTNSGMGLRGSNFYGYVGATAWPYTSYRYGTVDNTRSFTYGGRGVR